MVDTSGIGSTLIGHSYEDYLNEQRQVKSELGKEDFLSLLAAQLQYQNPLEPMADTAFVAQLAEFSSLEQITNLTDATSASHYYGLAGKFILGTVRNDAGQTAEVYGHVDRVIKIDNQFYCEVNGVMVEADDITQIYDNAIFEGENPILNSAHLIGSYVQSYIVDEEGQIVTEDGTPEGERVVVSGRIERLTTDGTDTFAYLEGVEDPINVGLIFDISAKSSTEAEPETEAETEQDSTVEPTI